MKKSNTNLSQNTRNKLEKFAQSKDSPYKTEDLIIPDSTRKALDSFINEAQRRKLTWENYTTKKFNKQKNGLLGFFSGSSGTGKTIAASIIANELKLNLYRVDLSQIVSKYIGETEKNLDKIFAEAETSNAILFFDEADALFGKRSEVKDSHDSYTNIDTNYLLQAMENYQGISLLSSNIKKNLDIALKSRLGYVMDFPTLKTTDGKR